MTREELPPGRQGFRMPAEWHPHRATWFSWPTNEETWPGRVEQVQSTFMAMFEATMSGEVLEILVDDQATADALLETFSKRTWASERFSVRILPTRDSWIRDYGPNFVIDGSGGLRLNNWRFDAWDGKYPELAADDGIPGAIAETLGMAPFEPEVVLEGGSIDVNGRGLCLTTRHCLLETGRNPGLGREEFEAVLSDYLGVDRTIWLHRGVVGDDTDSHIDVIARFVAPDHILCAVEEDPEDSNHAPLRENFEILQEISRKEGLFRVTPLVMPEAVRYQDSRLPASYANFYIANGVVLVPAFDQGRDREALETIGSCFPERSCRLIDSRDLLIGLGGIHCLTQQEPLPFQEAPDEEGLTRRAKESERTSPHPRKGSVR